MLANFEQRAYKDYGRVWIGRYQNLHNLAHWHLEHELIYIEEGDVLISYNDQSYSLKKGDLAFIHSGQIHYIDSERDGIVQIIMYNGDFLAKSLLAYRLENVVVSQAYSFLETFSTIEHEQKNKDLFYIENIHIALEKLILKLYRKEPLITNPVEEKNENLHDYQNLLQKIHQESHEITFTQAADFMGLSNAYFSRYFHKMAGMTFSRYLNTIKIEKAIELLKLNTKTVTEISILCGFDTIRHFHRVFKEITGLTPKQLPSNFMLYHHTTKVLHDSFDPTLGESILL